MIGTRPRLHGAAGILPLVVFAVAGAGLGVVPANGAAAAATRVAVNRAVIGQAVATPGPAPSISSPITLWQSWANAQRSFATSFDWSEWVQANGCSATSIQVIPVVAHGNTGIPEGIVTDAVSLSGSCAHTGLPTSSRDVVPSGFGPDIANCPNMYNCTSKSVTTGIVAVGTDRVPVN